MKAKRFPKNMIAAIRDEKILGIRAGMKPHRVIGIWMVVVESRVFVVIFVDRFCRSSAMEPQY